MTATSEIEPTSIVAIEGFTLRAVRDVFKAMLSLTVEPAAASLLPCEAKGQILGSVGFIGEISGVIYLSASAGFGLDITRRMLGLSESEVDDPMVNDAFGELCNMVVGAVKSRICDSGLHCVLTVPSIVRGNNISIQASATTQRTALGFRVGEERLLAEVMVKVR